MLLFTFDNVENNMKGDIRMAYEIGRRTKL